MATGKIVQVIGAVVDVEFPRMPYRACTMLLRCKMVMSVCAGSSAAARRRYRAYHRNGFPDGLRRGLDVKDLEHPIEVP